MVLRTLSTVARRANLLNAARTLPQASFHTTNIFLQKKGQSTMKAPATVVKPADPNAKVATRSNPESIREPTPLEPPHNRTLPDYIKNIGDEILKLNIAEHVLLQQYIQKKLGMPGDVTDASVIMNIMSTLFGPMASMPAGAGGAAQQQQAQPEQAAQKPAEEKPVEKTEFDVTIEKAAPEARIKIIKELRTIFPSLGLKEARDLVDEAPKVIKKGCKKDEANDLKKKLEAAGAVVKLE